MTTTANLSSTAYAEREARIRDLAIAAYDPQTAPTRFARR